MELYFKVLPYVLAGLFGLCVGSFLNVVIYRVPAGLNLSLPSSHCPKCKYVLKWYDNIPVISYIMLGGKCRKCKQKISIRYTIVEIVNMLLWLLSAFLFWNVSIPFACFAAVISSLLLCIFFIDLEHKLIFDRFIIIIGVIGIAATFLDPYYDWFSHVIGGALGFGFFYGIALLFFKLKNKEGLGGGDIKLSAVMGLFLGWERLMLSILIATISASIILVILSHKGKKDKTDEEKEYPFGPFLTVGFAISMFAGNYIIDAYLSLLGL